MKFPVLRSLDIDVRCNEYGWFDIGCFSIWNKKPTTKQQGGDNPKNGLMDHGLSALGFGRNHTPYAAFTNIMICSCELNAIQDDCDLLVNEMWLVQ